MSAGQSRIRGAIFVIAAQFFAALLGVIIKAAHESLPLEMIVFFRNFFGLLVLLPFILKQGLPGLKTGVARWHFIRAFTGLAAMYSYFYVVGELKLVNATTIMMTAPIIIPFVAYVVLGERFNSALLIAPLIGFVGVMAMLQPEVHAGWAGLIGLAGSAFVALAQVSVRKLSFTEPAYRIVFYFTALALIVSAIPLLWSWQTPATLWQWALVIALGPVATLSQLCLTRGYALAPVSSVGVFIYTSVFFAVVLGWLFWGEIWELISIAGAILIIGAGAVVLKYQNSPGR